MKKILTILLISIILPITTHALNPKIVVGGTELTGSVLEVNGTTGKATYNPSTKTLTLDNYSYNGIGEITEYLDYSEFKSVISISFNVLSSEHVIISFWFFVSLIQVITLSCALSLFSKDRYSVVVRTLYPIMRNLHLPALVF